MRTGLLLLGSEAEDVAERNLERSDGLDESFVEEMGDHEGVLVSWCRATGASELNSICGSRISNIFEILRKPEGAVLVAKTGEGRVVVGVLGE